MPSYTQTVKKLSDKALFFQIRMKFRNTDAYNTALYHEFDMRVTSRPICAPVSYNTVIARSLNK